MTVRVSVSTPRRCDALRRWSAAVTVVALVSGISACQAADPHPQATATGTGATSQGNTNQGANAEHTPAIPEGFEKFYTQPVTWHDCQDVSDADEFECATLAIPQSWSNAAAGEAELAIIRKPAAGTAQGSLLVNPGGPGASGVDYLPAAWSTYGKKLVESFDLVSFDPRGVQRSTPVKCMDDEGKDAYLAASYPSTPQGIQQAADQAKAWAEACAENTGPFLGEVDTQSAARDMDMMRAALGDSTLHYLGFSYGTQLGAAYAGIFPDNVGNMVLDGAIDITLTADETSAQQAAGFEQALRAYVADCQGGTRCPLTGSVDDGLATIKTILDRALNQPIPTSSGRELTQTLAFYGIAVTLYDERSWQFLTQGLSEVITAGTGDTLLFLADFYNDRNEDGTFSTNSTEAFTAVGCLDARGTTDLAQMEKDAAEIMKSAPTMGGFFGYGGLSCQDWKYPVAAVDYDISAPGAVPIVVVGTTGDPATPYRWAEALASTLQSGTLLTFTGEGHTAYGRSNECIMDAVDGFLVDGTVPAAGTKC
ncbi:MAG: alpha/beta hydrolase [Cellulomonadaceae bacterium]|nr:alpha/beta hydrolase [Cellulomonadaceae bacterium]